MKKICLLVFLACFGLFTNQSIFAQAFAKVGTVGAQFLEIGVGARAIGMGEAFAAVADDATSIFWNPAGMTRVAEKAIFISHTDWVLDIRQESVAYVQNLDLRGSVGVFLSLFSLGEFDGQNIYGQGETFTPQYFYGGVSYAKMLTDKFSFGVNLKGVRQDFDVQDNSNSNISAQNWAVDLGSLYNTGWKSLRIGMSVFHFGPELTPSGKYDDFENNDLNPAREKEFKPYDLPLTFRVGLAMEVIEKEDRRLTVAFDWTHPNDNLEKVHLGGEFTLSDLLVLRGGYKLVSAEPSLITPKNYDHEGFNAGAGFLLSMGETKLNLDYGFADFNRLTDVHRVSVGYSF